MSNLLPKKEKDEIAKLYKTRFISVALFSLSALSLAGSVLLFPSYYSLESTENALIEKKNSYSGRETTGINGSLTTALTDVNARLAVFSDQNPASPIVHSFIDPILSAKTSLVRITDLSFSADPKNVKSAEVKISGTTSNRDALLEFSNALSRTSGVSNVSVPITSFLKNSDLMFTISATVDLK